MKFETLSFAARDHVARVILNRPERLNALCASLVADLTAAARHIEADASIRAVLLTGAGRAFCSGADLLDDEPADGPGQGRGAAVGARMRDGFNPMVRAWFHLPLPVVVAVNGIAAGAGSSLALCGDIVLAAKSASFVQLFAPKLGLMPDLGGSFHLPRSIGTARAKGLSMLGEPLSAADAAAWGLIWACVDDADLHAEAERIAARLAAGPTQAYRRIKAAFNTEPPNTLDEQLALEARLQAELADTEDFAEGLRAFRDKRAPRFGGR